MSASSLASILTPNLLRPPVERTATTSERELANHASCVGVVEMLIECVGYGWTAFIPAEKHITENERISQRDRNVQGCHATVLQFR